MCYNSKDGYPQDCGRSIAWTTTIPCVSVHHTCITNKISTPVISILWCNFWAPVTGHWSSLLIFRWHFKYNLQTNMTATRQYREFVELRQWCLAARMCYITSAKISSTIAKSLLNHVETFSLYICSHNSVLLWVYARFEMFHVISVDTYIYMQQLFFFYFGQFCGNKVKAHTGLH